MTRIVIAATSPTVRAGLGALLSGNPAFTVLESAARPEALAEVAEMVEADVVLLALEPSDPLPLPLTLPPDAVGRAPVVVVLGDDSGEGWAARALRAGARGALPRTATGEQITAAVAAAAAGLTVVPNEAGALPPRPALVGAAPPVQPLTPRELEVLGMLAEGSGNKVIAARLGISEHTVKTHVGAIFGKLGVSSRAEAVASAARLGLLML
ncbi:MAG TPA: response regulator transcription factor [Gemmatimonadales bacterium]